MTLHRLLAVGALAALVGLPTSLEASPPPKMPVQAHLTDSEGNPLTETATVVFTIFDAESDGNVLHQETQEVEPDNGAFTAYLGEKAELDLSIFRDHDELWVELTVNDETLSPRLRLATAPYAAAATHAASAGDADSADDADQLGGVAAEEYYSSQNPMSWENLVDKPDFQAPVDGSCSDGQRLVGLEADGTPVCEKVVSSVAAGSGLTASSSATDDQDRPTGDVAMSIADGGVGNAKLAENSVTGTELDSNAVTSGHISDGTIQQADLSSDSVGANELQDDAVDSAAIQNGQVQKADLSGGSVGNNELQSDAVQQGNIKKNSVGSSELKSGSVTTNHIKNNTIDKSDIGKYGCGDSSDYGLTSGDSGYNTCLGTNPPSCANVPPGGICEGASDGCGAVGAGYCYVREGW